MRLSEFMRGLSHEQRETLAVRAGTGFAHLRNVAFSGRSCGIQLAVDLERLTAGSVRRWDMRPDDWHRIWPELIGAHGAPPVPASQEVAA